MTRQDIDYPLVTALEKYATPLTGAMSDYDSIVEAASVSQFVLIGEATHGTREFYHARAKMTQRLIREKGFDAVAVEADWPDAYAVNRYVQNQGNASNANDALKKFERFPTWMWRNTEVLHFVQWLHEYNLRWRRPEPDKTYVTWPVGFYGLDLYSMNTSVHAVISYLDRVDPAAARRARIRYNCLYHFMDRPQAYGYATEAGIADSCEDEIVAQLIELRQKAFEYMKADGFVAEDDYFCAKQNAELVKDAEQYYRALYRGYPNSWNLRDKHMFETLENLKSHLENRLQRNARIVVWAHNSHIGNAGATEMQARGEFNIGQLVKAKYGKSALLVGASTSRGTVTAADDWDGPEQTKKIIKPFPGSYENVFHHVNHKKFMLDLRASNEAVDGLMEPRLQRAIGVIYRPETERQSHYFMSCLPQQFDFLFHYDETNAVEPLKTVVYSHKGEMDETYPYGL